MTCICVTSPWKRGRSDGGDRNHSLEPCCTCARHVTQLSLSSSPPQDACTHHLRKHRPVRMEGHAAQQASQAEGEGWSVELAVHGRGGQRIKQLHTSETTRNPHMPARTCCHLPPLVSPNMYHVSLASALAACGCMCSSTYARSDSCRLL